MAKILYVEDDTDLAARVKQWFSREGHLVELATTGEDALQLVKAFEFDLLFLDCSLPGISGFEVCRNYRRLGGKAWTIMLTGQSGIDEKEQGFESGADDYLVKPFEVRELSARVKSALKKSVVRIELALKHGAITLDETERVVKIYTESVRLTSKETQLLAYLMRNPNRVFGSKQLLNAVWPSESSAAEGTVRTIIGGLRKKLELAGQPDFIRTILGAGYTIGVEDLNS